MAKRQRDMGSGRDGFTLLEVLVATIISAFVALTAVASLQAVVSSRNKIDANVEVAAELNFVARMINGDLQNVARRASGRCNIVGVMQFSETTLIKHLTIRTINRVKARPSQAEGDVYEVEYYLLGDEEKSRLMRRVWPYPNNEGAPGGILTCIAENITGFDVRYYDGLAWWNEWGEDTTELPHLVEVVLVAELPGTKKVVRQGVLVGFARRPGQAIEPSTDIGHAEEDSESESETNEGNE